MTQTVSAGDGLIKGSSDKTLAGVTAYPNEGYHFVTWKASGTLGDMPDAIRDRDKLTAEVVMGLLEVHGREDRLLAFPQHHSDSDFRH